MNRVASLACVSFKSGAALAQPAHNASAGSWTGRASLLWAALLCCLLALAQPAHAQVLITTDTTISTAINGSVVIHGSPTVSVTSGGSTGDLIAFDTSKVNVSGGSIGGYLAVHNATILDMSGGSIGGILLAYDTSIVNVSDSSLAQDLQTYDTSTVTVSGGSLGGTLRSFSSSTVTVSGVSIRGDLEVFEASTVNVSGGSIAQDLHSFGTGIINIYSGSIAHDLQTFNTGTVNIYGGSLGGNLEVYNTGIVNVYGMFLRLTGPFTDPTNFVTYYTLTGTLQDGTPINKPVYLYFGSQISQIVLHNTDPFPALKAQVQALADNGTLNGGNTNALLVKLNAAQSAATTGDVAGERDALTAFVNQVNAFVKTGKLTAAQGQALSSAAQAIRNGLG